MISEIDINDWQLEETTYEILGLDYRIRSDGKIYKLKGEGFKKAEEGSGGYLQYSFTNKGVNLTRKIHKLVWEAFNGPVPEGYVIDHKDDNKRNNNLQNLQLLTSQQNSEKALAKHYMLTSPNGELVNIYNLSKFCRENPGLSSGALTAVAKGLFSQHKGWRCQYGDDSTSQGSS